MKRACLGCLGSVCVFLSAVGPVVAEPKPGERDVAGRIDAAFQRALKDTPLPPGIDDQAFIRRVYLDLTGKLPAPEEVRAFVADADAQKRGKLIDRLLESDAYANNWGRYWRDVVTYHTPASGNYLRWQLFDRWWFEQLKKNRPFDQVVTALVTAVGINDESPPVNYLTALYGNPTEIAATTARVFLGVQVQCAECHNARTEAWKREQFHELAAFFGRARIIQHKDVEGRGTPYAIEGRASGQYLMVDKKDPTRLIEMQPRFLTGEAVGADADDEDRRAALARYLTSPKNPYFARAYVNRMWTALMGWGFYPGLADLASHQVQPQYPEVLDLVAEQWIATGYDMKWLFRTLTLTRVYQSEVQPPSASHEVGTPAACPTPLRAEQVFEALQKALGFDENDKTIPAPAPSSSPMVQRHTGVRHMVYQAFRENPSLPFREVNGKIPQALLMMNSVLVNRMTSAKGSTLLAELIGQGLSDEQIVAALYERTLSRKPTGEEQAICKRYLGKVGNRHEALEDIHWSLINSTEFLIKK